MIVLLAALLATAQSGPPTLYERGVVARRAGDNAGAVAFLEQATRLEPANADVWVQYGFALRDLGRSKDSRNAFETALRLAPDYQDARDGLASLGVRTQAGKPVEIAIDGSVTRVGGGPDWREIRAAVSLPLSAQTRLAGAIERSHRFNRSDTFGEARLDLRNDNASSVYVSAGGTVEADYRPVWQIGVGGTRKVAGTKSATVLTFDGAIARFRSGDILTASPGVQHYFASGRGWLTGRWINIFADGHHESGALGRVDFAPSENVRIFAGAARAPDLSEGVVIRTTSLFAGTSVRISNTIDGTLSATRDKPDDRPQRTTISAGLRLRVP